MITLTSGRMNAFIATPTPVAALRPKVGLPAA
jgi:hypothetical protein